MSATVDICTRVATPAVVTDVTTDSVHLSEAFDDAYRNLVIYLGEQGIAPIGPRFAVYHEVTPDAPWRATVGFPVTETGPGSTTIHKSELPGGKVAVIVHEGPYEGLAETWTEIGEWMRTHHVKPAGAPWESYVVEDSTEPEPSRWRTEIVWPVTDR